MALQRKPFRNIKNRKHKYVENSDVINTANFLNEVRI